MKTIKIYTGKSFEGLDNLMKKEILKEVNEAVLKKDVIKIVKKAQEQEREKITAKFMLVLKDFDKIKQEAITEEVSLAIKYEREKWLKACKEFQAKTICDYPKAETDKEHEKNIIITKRTSEQAKEMFGFIFEDLLKGEKIE